MAVDVISDFWLGEDLEESLFKTLSIEGEGTFYLAACRRLVSNFVCIMTNENIPVKFLTTQFKNFTDGKTVWLSATIKNKADFDWSIGLALHEASHILLSDFEMLNELFGQQSFIATPNIRTLARQKSLPPERVRNLCKWVFNFVEDRYIDSYTFDAAPGYRGYYRAMYNKLWNSKRISKALKSKRYRKQTLKAYEIRVLNLTNPNTDLDALPGLRDIAILLDIENILRLKTCNNRLNISYQIVEIILNNIDALPDFKENQELEPEKSDSTINQISKVLGGNNPTQSSEDQIPPDNGEIDDDPDDDIDDDGEDESDDVDEPEDSGETEKQLDEDLKKQKDMLEHDFSKHVAAISKTEEKLVNVIDTTGVSLVPTGVGYAGTPGVPLVHCFVVKKLTQELIDAGTEIFPLSQEKKDTRYSETQTDSQQTHEAVMEGITLGKRLGKKLQIFGEETNTKYIRRALGKIEKRLLPDIGVGSQNIFQRTVIKKWNKSRLHISVDASGSMAGQKWYQTMKCLSAICSAADTIENLAVSVSFRCSHQLATRKHVPYVLLAYDSSVDKLSKIKSLFPQLVPNGGTPEGLVFEAIMNNFIIGQRSNEKEHYFINISDGQPFYMDESTGIIYQEESAVQHTKVQINKVRSRNVRVLSYFIDTKEETNMFSVLKTDFKSQFSTMYGKDAKFVDVTNVMDISKTLNRLFISTS